jgi:hypothetical protein
MNKEAEPHFEILQTLEIELHKSSLRQDITRLNALLHPDFVEFGRSGKRYSRADILKMLPAEQDRPVIWADHFDLRMLSPSIALLTYQSAHVMTDGKLERCAWRTSIWQATDDGWQMSFHQGTPIHAWV